MLSVGRELQITQLVEAYSAIYRTNYTISIIEDQVIDFHFILQYVKDEDQRNLFGT